MLPTITSLYGLQLAGYVLPLISFPYLLRILGVERFGLYAFVLVLARYMIVVTDYGFPFSATRDISVLRGRGEDPGRVFTAVMTARLVLLVGCGAVLATLTLFVPRFAADAGLFWIGFAGVAGSALFPLWLFQAYERLPLLIGGTLALRAIGTALIFVFVTDRSDVAPALVLWSAPWIAGAIYGLWAARNVLGIHLARIRTGEVFTAFHDGFSIFVAIIAGTLYTTSSAFVLGLISGNTAVGYFAAAEAVIIAVRGLLDPLSQALFPLAARLGSTTREATLAHARKALRVMGTMGALLGVGTLVLAPWLGPAVFGSGFGPSVRLLQIMSVMPLAVAVIIVAGTQLMLPLRMDRRYTTVALAGGLFNIALTLVLVPPLAELGTAIGAAVTETLIALTLLVYLRVLRLPLIGRVAA